MGARHSKMKRGVLVKSFWVSLLFPTAFAAAAISQAALVKGTYHLVFSRTETFRWHDSLFADTSRKFPVWQFLKLGSFVLKDSGADLCVAGSHSFGDYGWKDFDLCGHAVLVDRNLSQRIHGFSVAAAPTSRSQALKLARQGTDSLFFSFTPSQDTISLSMFWICSGQLHSFFVPGDWTVGAVDTLCKLYIDADPILSQQDFPVYNESFTVARINLKLVPGAATGLARAVTPERIGAHGDSPGKDALGRDQVNGPTRAPIGTSPEFRLVPH